MTRTNPNAVARLSRVSVRLRSASIMPGTLQVLMINRGSVCMNNENQSALGVVMTARRHGYTNDTSKPLVNMLLSCWSLVLLCLRCTSLQAKFLLTTLSPFAELYGPLYPRYCAKLSRALQTCAISIGLAVLCAKTGREQSFKCAHRELRSTTHMMVSVTCTRSLMLNEWL